MGYIYVMTNESYTDNIIKIGYTDDIERRQKELYTTAVPVPFDIYCTYETNMKNSDKIIHERFSKFRVNGKREFFRLAPEEVYKELLLIARLSGTTDKLRLYDNKEETNKTESSQQASEIPQNSPRTIDKPISNTLQQQYFGLLNRPPLVRGSNFSIFRSDHNLYELNPYIIRYKNKWFIINAGYLDSKSHIIATRIFSKAYQLFVQSGFTQRKVKFEMDYGNEGTPDEILSELTSWGQSRHTYDEEPTQEISENILINYFETVILGINSNKTVEIAFREPAFKMLQDNSEIIEYIIEQELKGETYEASATI